MPTLPKLTNTDDRSIPERHEGTLEPNYYCRAWNAKRDKYCRSVAGRGTDHPGVGRCRNHDGNAAGLLKHGRHRRYASITSQKLREVIEQQAGDENPLDLREELGLARALLEEFLRREHENSAALGEGIKHVERIVRVVEAIERIKAQNAITPQELNRLMLNMGLVVRQHVGDPDLCQRIQDGWLGLRV